MHEGSLRLCPISVTYDALCVKREAGGVRHAPVRPDPLTATAGGHRRGSGAPR